MIISLISFKRWTVSSVSNKAAVPAAVAAALRTIAGAATPNAKAAEMSLWCSSLSVSLLSSTVW